MWTPVALLAGVLWWLWRRKRKARQHLVSVAVGNVNMGGRFNKAFEFMSTNEDWMARYEKMCGVLDEEAPPGGTWRDLYPRLDTSLDLYVKAPVAVHRGHTEAWPTNPQAYLARHRQLAHFKNATDHKRTDIALFDLFCDTALTRAFTKDEYEDFEKGLSHLARTPEAVQRKVDLILRPLQGLDILAVQEVTGDLSRDGYSVLYKRDAELAVLYRDLKHTSRSVATNWVDLQSGDKSFVVDMPDFDELDLPDAQAKRKALDAMETTRRRTLAVEFEAFVVFVVHAKRHVGTAVAYLAKYVAALVASTNKPCVVLGDFNVERQDECRLFDSVIEDLGIAQPAPTWLTTFKERTVFQAQQSKATIPPMPFVDAVDNENAAIAADIAAAQKPPSTRQGAVLAPKDRILVSAGVNIVDRAVVPRSFAYAATKPDADLRLPVPSWPSDHLAVVANLLIATTESRS